MMKTRIVRCRLERRDPLPNRIVNCSIALSAKKLEAVLENAQLQIERVASYSACPMAEPPLNDQQLLRRLGRGDDVAFAAIYDRHQGPIFRFVLHMTGSGAIAEEITQEVFMLLIRKPKAYRPEKGSLAAYLFGIARNLARDAVRRVRPSVPLDDTEESDLSSTGDWDVLEKLSHSEALDLLRKSLLGLPELYREVVVLCDLEETGYAEAAALLECSQGTVASRLHRAHAMLRTKLSRAMGKKPCLT